MLHPPLLNLDEADLLVIASLLVVCLGVGLALCAHSETVVRKKLIVFTETREVSFVRVLVIGQDLCLCDLLIAPPLDNIVNVYSSTFLVGILFPPDCALFVPPAIELFHKTGIDVADGKLKVADDVVVILDIFARMRYFTIAVFILGDRCKFRLLSFLAFLIFLGFFGRNLLGLDVQIRVFCVLSLLSPSGKFCKCGCGFVGATIVGDIVMVRDGKYKVVVNSRRHCGF
jgi:hypothetical protein